MIIWIIALLVLALLAWIGYAEGAISALVSLVGLILALFLSLPLGPLIRPVFPLLGVNNPYLLWVLPPLAVFVLFLLVFAGIAFAIQRKVRLYYKYKADDVERMRWERLNQRVGLVVGLVRGGVYMLLLGVIIYVAGYASVQLSNDNSPMVLQMLTTARKDLASSGLDKTTARFDPMSELFYEASDILGLIYHNPLLYSRLADYPAFLSLGERSEFQEIATDTDFNQMLQSQESIIRILNHPKIQAIVKNPEIMQLITGVDPQDLQQYLTTGKSPKFADERILGHWQVNLALSLTELKKASTNFADISWIDLRNTASPILAGITLKFTTENKVYMKVQPKEAPAATAASATSSGSSGGGTPRRGTAPTPRSLTARVMPGVDPQQAENQRRMAQRYGAAYRSSGAYSPPPVAVAVVAPPRPPPENPLKKLASAEGSWQRKDDVYSLNVAFPGSKQPIAAKVNEDRMVLVASPFTLVCDRQ
jgi:hypothetical protein